MGKGESLWRFARSAQLAGVTTAGVLMAIFQSNAGGAWDNAKKMIEEQGRKGTDAHKAAVVGDTVGDPFKDTSGPSLNILLKLISVVALVIAPSIALSADTAMAYAESHAPQQLEKRVEVKMEQSGDDAVTAYVTTTINRNGELEESTEVLTGTEAEVKKQLETLKAAAVETAIEQ